MTEANVLTPLAQQYFDSDLAGAVRVLETMDESQVIDVLRTLPPELAAKAVGQLQVGYTAAVLSSASDADLFRAIATQLDAPQAAGIFVRLAADVREQFLEVLPDKVKRAIEEQLSFPEDSVARLMSTRFLAFRNDLTVEDTIERVRKLAKRGFPSSYAYVIDSEELLVGVINMRDLMLADPHDSIAEVMRKDVFTLHCFTHREEAANELSRRKYFAAPVVDSEGKILGIIKAEQLLQEVQEEIGRDIQQMVGAGRNERAFSPISYSLKTRLPWLNVNLATAFLAAAVVAAFEDVIAQLTVLAVFLPVVAGQGGNAGAQSLAIVMRGLVMREIPRERVRRLILKEGLLGCLNGIATGLVTALIAILWYGNPYLGLVIGLAMIVNLASAGLAGASIPLLMKRFGLDPAQCSSIVLTTVTDVVGFLGFLGFATLFYDYLV